MASQRHSALHCLPTADKHPRVRLSSTRRSWAASRKFQTHTWAVWSVPPRKPAHSMPRVGRSRIRTKNTEQRTAPAQVKEPTATSKRGYVVLLLLMATTHTSKNIRKAHQIMDDTIPRQRRFKPTNAADRRASTSRRSAASGNTNKARRIMTSTIPRQRRFKPTNAADRRANTSRRSAAHIAMAGGTRACQVNRMLVAPRTTTTIATTRNQAILAVLILQQRVENAGYHSTVN